MTGGLGSGKGRRFEVMKGFVNGLGGRAYPNRVRTMPPSL